MHERELIKLLAFAARYGHQGYAELKTIPITELMKFTNALGELLIEESDAIKRGTDA